MNLLDRYKTRILNTFKISLEDWWDDLRIKYLGDDYRDRGQPDVWEEPELPEQLGVKSPVWTELLTRSDDSMFRYRNLNNNSGVAAYDTGVDWFLIKFNDSSLYLYTTKSTTKEHINYMRILAREGKGLNSYVNRIVGNQYAGRNYKGNLTLMPGMESISNPKALRALQLIIAHQNTLKGNNMSITLEHFEKMEQKSGKDGLEPNAKKALDIAKQLLGKPSVANEGFWSSIGDFFAGRPTSVTMKGTDENLRRLLRATVMDKVWLSRQKFREGQIEPVVMKGFDVRSASRFMNDYESGLSQALQHNRNEIKKVTTRLKIVEAYLTTAINSFRPVDTSVIPGLIQSISPWGNYTQLTMREPELLDQTMIPTPMEALSKDEVVKFAKLIDDVMLARTNFLYESTLRENPVVNSMQLGMMERDSKRQIAVPEIKRLIKAYKDFVTKINQDIKLSFKTHAANINAENLADSLINCMSKSITNINNTGFESHVVSNEGIWGAVKYLFGGNYENLPKINAAYDEAVDAVKATYGNPQWVKARRLNTGKPIKLKGSYYNEIARDPAKALKRAEQENRKSVASANQYIKEEVEYLNKFIKPLTSGDETKIKALLDMFEIRESRSLDVAEEVEFDDGGEVVGMSAEQISKAADVFIEAVKYRRATDAFYNQGMYKLMYTDSGRVRYGKDGDITAKLSGPAKELSIKIGQNADNVERSFYNSFGPAWDNIDMVVRGTLAIMEASAD